MHRAYDKHEGRSGRRTLSQLSLSGMLVTGWLVGSSWGAPGPGADEMGMDKPMGGLEDWTLAMGPEEGEVPPPPPPGGEMREGERGREGREGRPMRRPMGPEGRPMGGPMMGGPGGEMGPGGAGGPPMPELTEEQMDNALAVIQDQFPIMGKIAAEARKNNPQRFRELMKQRWPQIAELMEMKKRDPEMYNQRVEDMKLGRQTMELVDQYRAAQRGEDAAKMEELKPKLREVLEKQFAIRQQIREAELKRLEARLEQFRKQVETRASSRDELIEQRMGELTGEEPKVEW